LPLRNVVTNNLNLKVASVVVAVFLWLFAKGEQTGDRQFSIPLVLRNVPSGLTTVERIPDSVEVVISGDNKELVKLSPLYKEGLSLLIDQIDVHNPGALADFAASMTTASGEELQGILALRSIRKRIEQVLILLKREIEISKLKTQISQRIEERMSKQQREFFLNQQLKEIKEELGLSKGEAQTEIEAFQERIDRLTLTEEARERWQRIDRTYSYLIGPCDDLMPEEYAALIRAMQRGRIKGDPLEWFRNQATALRDPRINSMVLRPEQMGQWRTLTKGMRFFGPRYLPDSELFQEVTVPKVRDRLFPSGLDVMAANGAARARQIARRLRNFCRTAQL